VPGCRPQHLPFPPQNGANLTAFFNASAAVWNRLFASLSAGEMAQSEMHAAAAANGKHDMT